MWVQFFWTLLQKLLLLFYYLVNAPLPPFPFPPPKPSRDFSSTCHILSLNWYLLRKRGWRGSWMPRWQGPLPATRPCPCSPYQLPLQRRDPGGLPLAPGHGKALRGPQGLRYKAPMHVQGCSPTSSGSEHQACCLAPPVVWGTSLPEETEYSYRRFPQSRTVDRTQLSKRLAEIQPAAVHAQKSHIKVISKKCCVPPQC